jgi:DNA-binding CsgD family transcriptional regulator
MSRSDSTGSARRGEAHPLHKLTAENVRQIRMLAEGVTQKELAERFGVNQTTIGQILKRETWKHL